jgi:CHAT domain-containing protein
MGSGSKEEDRLVQYLLGLMPEQEAAKLEEVYLANDELNDNLQAAERELIDRYVEGTLSKIERDQFESFFLCSPGRHERLRFAKALKAYGLRSEAKAVVPKQSSFVLTLNSFFRSYAGMAVAAMLLIAVGIAAWRVFLFKSPEQETLLALNNAYTNGRLFESRISGVDYAPMAQLRGESRDDTRLAEAELLALKQERENPGAPAFHTLGRVYLAGQKFDKAIEWLDKAAQVRPDDAGIQSDLGAAFLEKGRQEPDPTKRAEAMIKSLAHLDKALQLDESLLEARFNRALLHEQMHLTERAKADWQRYIEKDANSGWADEARKRLAQLEEKQNRSLNSKESDFDAFVVAAQNGDDVAAWKILSRNRHRGDNYLIQRLIDEYLAEQSGSDAGTRFQMISLAGKLELERTGDRFTTDLAAYYLKATPRQRELSSQGRRLLKSGLESYRNAEFEDSAQLYRRAESAFMQAGNTCEALMAQALVGASYLRVPYADRALAIFERLVSYSSDRGYKLLLARALHSVADAENSRREFSKSLESAARALDIYESVGESSGELWSLQVLVANYQELGELYKSTGFAFRALDVAASLSPQPFEVWPLYQQTAGNLNALGFTSMALGFEESALRLAVESGVPLLRSRSYAMLASIHQKLNNHDAALKNGQLALDEANSVKGETIKANLVAHSTLNLAHIYREMGTFTQALSLYNRSIELHQQLNQQLYVAEAHKGKLESLIALKDYDAAGEEIKSTIDLLEQDRTRITEDANRNSYFDLAQSTYDLAVDFNYFVLQNSEAAFAYSEASHARSLLDLVSTGGEVVNGRGGMDVRVSKVVRPLSLAEIQQRLPEHSQILQYSVLEDKLVAWVISKTSTDSKHVSVPELTANVTGFVSALTKAPPRNVEEINNRAKLLYELLITPVATSLNRDAVIFIVPDKILNIVPFGALVSPQTGRYFVEDYVFGVAPSSNLVIKDSDRASARGGLREESALVIGNPSFDSASFPLLPDLPAAATEAESVARLYGAAPLIGVNAPANRVKARMPEAEVIHFAGHYVADERSPLLSKLLLSKSAGQDAGGVLTASEVYRINLNRARLVVLSACTTGVERYYRGEGAIGMARPFIEAGAPLVVASLWAVESEPTSRLMIDFHKHRKLERMSAVRALRQAKLDMLTSPEPIDRDPHTWAAFVTIGGFAEF